MTGPDCLQSHCSRSVGKGPGRDPATVPGALLLRSHGSLFSLQPPLLCEAAGALQGGDQEVQRCPEAAVKCRGVSSSPVFRGRCPGACVPQICPWFSCIWNPRATYMWYSSPTSHTHSVPTALRFCGMVQFPGEVRKKVFLQLFLLLCHPFPMVSVTPGCAHV